MLGFDAEAIKALSQSGVAVLMFLVVVVVVWGVVRGVAVVREIAAAFHVEQATTRKDFQDQIRDINGDNRVVIREVTKTVQGLDVTVREVARTVQGLDVTVQRLDRSLVQIQDQLQAQASAPHA